jgi:hypothetical protein
MSVKPNDRWYNCWSNRRRKLIEARPKAGSPTVHETLLRVAALYKIEDGIRGQAPDHRRAVRQDMSRPLVDAFFDWLSAPAASMALHVPRTEGPGSRVLINGDWINTSRCCSV